MAINSVARPDGPGSREPDPQAVPALPGFDPSRVLASLAWIEEQANSIMAIAAGAATTHGDPSGALEMISSMASDIAINAALDAERLQ